MSGQRYLIDTNVIIDYLAGDELVISFLDDLIWTEMCLSVINRMELFSLPDLTPEISGGLTQFLASLTVIPLNEDVERTAITLRRNTNLKLPDAIVAATAWTREATLITRDKRLVCLKWPGLNILQPV